MEGAPEGREQTTSMGWEEKAAGTAPESRLHLPYHSADAAHTYTAVIQG